MFAKTPSKSTMQNLAYARSDGRVSAPTPTALDGLEDLTPEVLCNVGHVADGVAMREEVPAAGAVAVVVEPRAEDEIGCDTEEETSECQRRLSKVVDD